MLHAMAIDGTAAYDDVEDLPPLVRQAVEVAILEGFTNSCLPSHGRLLQVLACGVGEGGVIGETGTGCGVGLAWLASGARCGVRLVSVERDARLVEATRSVMIDLQGVTIVHGDWRQLRVSGPFDLLVLDGGGQGKTEEPPISPPDWLRPGGLVVLDDFTPSTTWPPLHDGQPDEARLHWLRHPQLLATQVRTQPDAVTVLGTFIGERSVP